MDDSLVTVQFTLRVPRPTQRWCQVSLLTLLLVMLGTAGALGLYRYIAGLQVSTSRPSANASSPASFNGILAQAMVSQKSPLLVEFWSPNCAPCRRMQPIVESLIAEGRQVIRVNVQRDPNAARTHGVSSIPTFAVYRDGQLQNRIVGATSRDRLIRLMED